MDSYAQEYIEVVCWYEVTLAHWYSDLHSRYSSPFASEGLRGIPPRLLYHCEVNMININETKYGLWRIELVVVRKVSGVMTDYRGPVKTALRWLLVVKDRKGKHSQGLLTCMILT